MCCCNIVGGQLNKEIAAELGISKRTTKVRRGHVMEKLGVADEETAVLLKQFSGKPGVEKPRVEFEKCSKSRREIP